MHKTRSLIAAAMLAFAFAQPLRADCSVIDQLDKLYVLQMRLAANPDTALFRTDIRQLRGISSLLSESGALQATNSNAILGRGADVVRFLRQTETLLLRVSLDDPQTVRPHFTRDVRETLAEMGSHLKEWRCTDDQIAIAQAAPASDPIRATSDAEDLAAVNEALAQAAREIVQPRSLVLLILVVGIISMATPYLQRWLILRRRREKRHNTNYATQYHLDAKTAAGRLVDINCYGTKLRHADDKPLPNGTRLAIDIAGQTISGTVMWSNQYYSGVKFQKMISLEQVAAIQVSTEAAAQMQNGAPKDAVM